MTTKKSTIEVRGNNDAQIAEITALVQWTLDNIKPDDVQKLLTKVEKKPSLVKTAIAFA